jgi:Thioredoxin
MVVPGPPPRNRPIIPRVITPERFATGMTFDEYVRYVGTPENLAREAGWWLGAQRQDFSGLLRAWYARMQLSGLQMDAIRWLALQPGGPAKVLVISEEWSSDCRRDVPALARLAEAGGLDLRILPRDWRCLYRSIEFPAVYHKERLFTAMQVARPGESREQAWERFIRDWSALQQSSPFFLLWASAAIDEIISALHERIVVGASG